MFRGKVAIGQLDLFDSGYVISIVTILRLFSEYDATWRRQ